MSVTIYTKTKNVDDFLEREKGKIVIVQMYAYPQSITATVKVLLAKKRIYVSINTIRAHLAEANVKYRSTKQKPLFSKTYREECKAWAAVNLGRDYLNVVFSNKVCVYKAI